jgi:MFS family permease
MSFLKTNRSTLIIVVCASAILMLSFGFRSTFGLFVQPVSDANGWGRDIIGLALAIQNLTWGVMAIVAGGLADRFGNAVVIVGGAALYCLGLWMTSGVETVFALQLGSGLLVGAGIAGTGFGVVLPLMAKAVHESQRQMALGIGTAAGSLGQFVLAPVTQQFIDVLGWAGALNLMALITLSIFALTIPLARLVPGAAGASVTLDTDSLRSTVMLAKGHASYWLLTTGFFVCGFHLAFITVHLPAYLTGNGFRAETGAWSLGLIGLCNVFGALAAGKLSSRFSMRKVLIAIYLGRAVAVTFLLLAPMSLASILIFSAVIGFLWLATVPPTTGLVATMFGTKYMATLYGVVFLGHQLGSFTGVWLGGWTYELTGNYQLMWWASVALSLIAVALHWPINETRVRASEPAAAV